MKGQTSPTPQVQGTVCSDSCHKGHRDLLSLTLCMMSLYSIIITSLRVCIYSCSIGLFVICPDDGNRVVTETLPNIFFEKMASDKDKLQNDLQKHVALYMKLLRTKFNMQDNYSDIHLLSFS